MNIELDTFNKILFLELRPWIFGRQSEIIFKQLLSKLKKEHYHFQPEYEIDFIRPLNNNRKYFKALIDFEAIGFLNQLQINVENGVNENAKKYFVHFALTRTLSQKLKETAQVIEERDYSPYQFDIKTGTPKRNRNSGNESYVLHYLKHQLVRLYMEVQEKYPLLLKEEILSQNDIYLSFFNHPLPKPTIINEAVKTSVKTFVVPSEARQTETFRAVTYDLRNESIGVIPYENIIKNPDFFSRFEEKLFQNGYISSDYNFTQKHGLKKELAIIYHIIIDKGYFKKRLFPGNKKIKDLSIRKFLDHRYNTNLDKQFRTFSNNPKAVSHFLDIHSWLSNLPTS